MEKIKLGVSACLLGHSVKYNGGHQRQKYLTDILQQVFELKPFCPEVAVGLGVPRPPIRLVRLNGSIRVSSIANPSADFTQKLSDYGKKLIQQHAQLSGFIVKKGSPSCGMERVKVYEDGRVSRTGVGAFTEAMQIHHPLLPIEEEGRLNDPMLRENFFKRVVLYHQWQKMIDNGLRAKSLIAYHSRHKYLIMTYGNARCRELGQLLADLARMPIDKIATTYIHKLMQFTMNPARRACIADVFYHIYGYLKFHLKKKDKEELILLIEDYRRGIVPFIAPMTLLKHYFRLHPQPYIQEQSFVSPYPDMLML